MARKIGITVVVFLVLFAIVVAMQPGAFTITRSATIAAPPARVFAIVNNMHRWNDWSPWARMDPAMTTTYAGPAAGVGASEHWVGKKVGTGTMTIVKSRPGELIEMRLDFERPMRATNTASFTFMKSGKHTEVVWTMTGRSGFVAKVYHLFRNMDKMVGGDFEKGLAELKVLAEKRG